MNAAGHSPSAGLRWPWLWRWFILAAATLILCACRADPHGAALGPRPSDSLPPEAWSGPPPAAMAPGHAHAVPAGATGAVHGCAACGIAPAGGLPLPEGAIHGWSPPGIAGPWPPDEFVCDGGDQDVQVRVNPDWTIEGLEPEDTIAHYDTLDGRRLVEPSNCTCIYAPRFAAVRRVTSIIENQQVDASQRTETPDAPFALEEIDEPTTTLQNVDLVAARVTKMPRDVERVQHDGVVSTALLPEEFRDSFLPFEDLAIIRRGVFEQSEKPRLAIAVDAAIVWSSDQAVQVILDRQAATEVDGDQRAQAVFSIKPRGAPKLKLCKVASRHSALPGDEVAFTLRFDNAGTQVIGNVTIVDHLSPRLEYIEGSAQASVEADFFTEQKPGGSLVLRCELINPLEPGQGGILRFRCRVR